MLKQSVDLTKDINKIFHFHLQIKKFVKIILVADQFRISQKILWVIVQRLVIDQEINMCYK